MAVRRTWAAIHLSVPKINPNVGRLTLYMFLEISRWTGLAVDVLGGVSESDLVVTHHVVSQHSEHLGPTTVEDGDSHQPSGPHMNGKDGLWRRSPSLA